MAKQKTDGHKGVSIVKRRGVFYLKWRTSTKPHDYRYAWKRLPSDVKSRKAASERAVRKAKELMSTQAELKYMDVGERPRASVAEACDAYVADVESERRGSDRPEDFIARSRTSLLKMLKPFSAHTGHVRCERLMLNHLEAYRTSLANTESLTAVGRNRYLDAARSAVRWFRTNGYVALPLSEIGQKLRHFDVNQKRPRILEQPELLRLVRALRKHDKSPRVKNKLTPFVAMMLLTGARPGEVEALTADDVRENRADIFIRAHKTNSEREAPWRDSPLLKELALALRLRAGGGPLVGPVLRVKMSALGELAGIERMNKQVLRRTTIAHVASGSDDSEYLLAARFGHTQAVSIRHYRKALPGVKERGDCVEQWLGIADELRALLVELGYITVSKSNPNPALGADSATYEAGA